MSQKESIEVNISQDSDATLFRAIARFINYEFIVEFIETKNEPNQRSWIFKYENTTFALHAENQVGISIFTSEVSENSAALLKSISSRIQKERSNPSSRHLPYKGL